MNISHIRRIISYQKERVIMKNQLLQILTYIDPVPKLYFFEKYSLEPIKT